MRAISDVRLYGFQFHFKFGCWAVQLWRQRQTLNIMKCTKDASRSPHRTMPCSCRLRYYRQRFMSANEINRFEHSVFFHFSLNHNRRARLISNVIIHVDRAGHLCMPPPPPPSTAVAAATTVVWIRYVLGRCLRLWCAHCAWVESAVNCFYSLDLLLSAFLKLHAENSLPRTSTIYPLVSLSAMLSMSTTDYYYYYHYY